MAGWFRSSINAIADTANRCAESIPAGVKQACVKVGEVMVASVQMSTQPTVAGVVPFSGRLPVVRPQEGAYVSLRSSLSRSVSNTVGRFTYELDKYKKNAMLIFHVSSYEGSYDTVDDVKKSFERFRFEVEVYHDITGDRMREVCEEFFSRDFTLFGAVVVVIIAPAAPGGMYRCPGSNFSNDDLLKYFWSSVPTTLREKPKIFLSQGDNQVIDGSQRRPTDLYSEERHVYELYLPATIYKRASSSIHNINCHPLSYICTKLEELGDRESFQDLAVLAISEARDQWPCTDPEGLTPFTTKTYNIMKSLNFWRN